MGKTIYAKILTLVVICTMVFAGTAVPAMADETENLYTNGEFGTDPNWTSWTFQAEGGYQAEGADNNTSCLISTGTNSVRKSILKDLTPGKVLEISLRVKMDASGEKIQLQAFPTIINEDSETQIPSGYNGRADASYAIEGWIKIAFRVVLAENANGLKLLMSGTEGVLVDSLQIIYADDNNLLTNGNFEETSYTDSTNTKPFMWTTNGELIKEGTNTYLSLPATDADLKTYLPNIHSVNGSVYKLTFRYKRPTAGSGTPRVYVGNDNRGTKGYAFNEAIGGNDWVTATAYFTNLISTSNQSNFGLEAATDVGYFDDVSLELIENSVNAEYFANSSTSFYSRTKNNCYGGFTIGSAANSTLPKAENTGYIFVNVWPEQGVSDTEMTVLAALYNKTNKQLCQIMTEDITCTFLDESVVTGHGFALIPFNLPQGTEPGEYEVKVFVWDGISGLKPFDKTISVLSGTISAAQ